MLKLTVLPYEVQIATDLRPLKPTLLSHQVYQDQRIIHNVNVQTIRKKAAVPTVYLAPTIVNGR